eukprot:TRINITY_DN5567_c0_g4_i1.p1 TRINITY_DN5567_c0_g4~~TRINITY_DN5567_c0_g4_i1.p1  ORF type:complete len:938 (+),score=153.42 TRINITY_DN5567_c0_g4_i1:31-2844(+)
MSQRDALDGAAFQQISLPWLGNIVAVDSSGSFASVAGVQGVALVSLTNTQTSHRVLTFPTVCEQEPRAIDWNHPSGNAYLCSVAMNTDIFMWNSESPLASPICILRHHRGTVTDLHWSHTDPNLLLTCSSDRTIALCDVRFERDAALHQTHENPVFVRWSRFRSHEFASAHDGDIHIWDARKLGVSVRMIKAHTGLTQSLDWSHTHPRDLVSCGSDGFMKFWDTESRFQFKGKISAFPPFHRAKYAPIGDYVVTTAKEGDYSISIWSPPLDAPSDSPGGIPYNPLDNAIPLYVLTGNNSKILDFCWRQTTQQENNPSIVTWSRDSKLRIWPMEKHIVQNLLEQTLCKAGERGDQYSSKLPEPEVKSRPRTTSFLETPKTLTQELQNIDKFKPNIKVEKVSADGNQVTLVVQNPRFEKMIRMLVVFPVKYPNKSMPTFEMLQGTTLDSAQTKKLKMILQKTASQLTSQCLPCFEACLRVMTSAMNAALYDEASQPSPTVSPRDGFLSEVEKDEKPSKTASNPINVPVLLSAGPIKPMQEMQGQKQTLLPSKDLSSIPPKEPQQASTSENATDNQGSMTDVVHFSRRCGAVFGPMNTLLVFGSKVYSANNCMVAGSLLQHENRVFDHSAHFIDEQASKASSRQYLWIRKTSSCDPNIESLAARYRVDGDPLAAARINKKAADDIDCQRLSQLWDIVIRSLTIIRLSQPLIRGIRATDEEQYMISRPDFLRLDGFAHPLGRPLIAKIFKHLEQLRDFQTISVLSSLLYSAQGPNLMGSSENLKSLDEEAMRSHEKKLSFRVKFNSAPKAHDLLPNSFDHFSNVIRFYTEYLHCYSHQSSDVMNHRLCVMKKSQISVSYPTGIGFQIICERCQRPSRAPSCVYCRRYAFSCSICHNPVQGLSHFCLVCGHGGHAEHIATWFQSHKHCPSGCGCRCLELSGC